MVLDEFGRKYFKLVAVEGKVKATFIVDRLIAEYNEIVKNCNEEVEQKIKNKAAESGVKYTEEEKDKWRYDLLRSGEYKERIESKLQEIRDLRTSEERYKNE